MPLPYDKIDPGDAPHARRTSWAREDGKGNPDNFVLVLEDEEGIPIAFANYDYDAWMEVFFNLVQAAKDRRKGK